MAVVVPAGRPPGLVLSADDDVGVAAGTVVSVHLQRFTAEEAGARAGDVEAVHQLRVATRRLRAVLRLLAPVLPAGLVRSLRRDLAWLAGAIGAVRDLDVLTQVVHARATRLEPESRRVLGPLALALHDARAARQTVLVEALGSTRCRRLLARLTAFAATPAPAHRQRLGDMAADLVRPLLHSVLRAGRRVTPDSPPDALHRLRVRAKRLRYALETLRGLGGKSVDKMLRGLVGLQETLGEGQDVVVAIAWLRSHGETAEMPPATLLAIGSLVEALARRARKLHRRFPEAWGQVDRRRQWSGVVAELAAGVQPRARAQARAARAPLRSTGS